jgi:Tfp pilus assembly protein PilX
MHKHKNNESRRRQQRGSVLLICIVLLFALTFIATVGATVSRAQIQMVRNHLSSQRAFAAAEAGIAVALNDDELGAADEATLETTVDGTAAVDMRLTYAGDTNIPGSGYSLGASLGAYHFQIESSASLGDGAAASQVQGMYLIGPGK